MRMRMEYQKGIDSAIELQVYIAVSRIERMYFVHLILM